MSLRTLWRGAIVCAIAGVLLARGAAAAEKPKIRAITAFVHIDHEHYPAQISEAMGMLRRAKSAFEQAGYEVQTVRITTQPFPDFLRGISHDQALSFLREYDALAVKEGFDTSIGPAMLQDSDDPQWVQLAAEALSSTKVLETSVVVAGDDGIHWRAITAGAFAMKYLEEHSPRSQGNFNFSATAMLPPMAPFYPGSYHLGGGHEFAVGLQSANVVAEVFARNHDPASAGNELARSLGTHAEAIERIAEELAKVTGWSYAGLDLSPAPLKEESIGRAIESFTGAKVGSSGTMTAVSVITAALKLIAVKHAGYSGLMLPILEDSVLSRRWSDGTLSLDALLAYSAVCGTGLDTVPLAGDINEQQLARIIGDMASLAVKWHKPLSARLLPAKGKRAGQSTEFDDPFLVNAVIQPLR